jgi:KDO2-lipid IV(A) lauroyltransferase
MNGVGAAQGEHAKPLPSIRRGARLMMRVSDTYRRCLGFVLGLIGPRAAYALLGVLARCVYRLFDPLRNHSEAQVRAALGEGVPDDEIRRLARQSFVHRVWSLGDLMLADRRVRAHTYPRYGGGIPEPYRSQLHAAKKQGRPLILITAYYGPFDLLPLFLGFNGFPAGVVYRPHRNPHYDAFRRRVRSASGCEMIPVEKAVSRLPEILEAGGTVAILSDHHAEKRGVPVTFMGLPTQASRAVGLLAEHYRAVVAVAGIRRLHESFQFEIVVEDMFDERAWAGDDDPIASITRRYVAAQEKMVRADPAQYLWGHVRWGSGLAAGVAGEPPAARDAD